MDKIKEHEYRWRRAVESALFGESALNIGPIEKAWGITAYGCVMDGNFRGKPLDPPLPYWVYAFHRMIAKRGVG